MSERLTLTLTVRATVDTAALAEHLTTDPVLRELLTEHLPTAEQALAAHLTPMLEDPVWDSPAELSVVGVIREERDSE